MVADSPPTVSRYDSFEEERERCLKFLMGQRDSSQSKSLTLSLNKPKRRILCKGVSVEPLSH
jgi:hypothetical protein